MSKFESADIVIKEGVDFSLAKIVEIYALNKWGVKEDYEEESVKASFSNSTKYWISFVNEREVGFCRVFSDMCSVTFISEILVHPDYQGKNIGSMFISEVLKIYSNTAVYALAFDGNVPFFERNGLLLRDKILKVVARKGGGNAEQS